MNKKEKRNILLYITGSSVSRLGSLIYSFMIGLFVLNTTGSGLKFATTLLIAFVPSLIITPFAGVFADRFDRKKIVVGMDMLNALLFLGLAFIVQLGELSLALIYLTTFVTNILTTFFDISFESAKPQLVDKKHLQSINSMGQIVMAATGILGPLLGGIAYAVIDIRAFIIVNAISFGVSAISEMFIDFKYNYADRKKKETFDGVFKSMKEGYYYLKGKKSIMQFFSLFVAVSIGFNLAVQVPLPFILNNHLGLSSSMYGIIMGVAPVGMILGAIFVGKITKRYTHQKLFVVLSNIVSVLIILLGVPVIFSFLVSSVSTTFAYFSVLMLAFGIVITLFDVPLNTLLQSSIEEEYRGRAFGILMPMIKIVSPIAYLLSGALLNVMNPFYIPLVVGIVLLVFFNSKRKLVKEEKLATA